MGNQISKKSKHVNLKANSVNSNNSESGVSTFTHFTDSTLETLKAEVDRQQTQHYLFKYAFQTSHFAPIEEILKLNTTSVLEIRQGLNPCWMNGK
jgi:hypothetical protein